MYWGAHLGTYYDLQMADVRTRAFVSYFFDARDKEDYEQAQGTASAHRFDYDGINGHRIQIGGFAEYALSDAFRPYVGCTFEQILSAEAKGTATDAQGSLALRGSDMEGSTGIVSLGRTTGNAADGSSFEAGLNGYFGERRGVTGQVQANWRFRPTISP